MKILFQFVHPYPHRSRVNRALLEAVRNRPEVLINDLYSRYPRLHIDVEREQALLREAEWVVFQHPFYWYSAPSLLKEWIDVVLEQGFAYGPEGNSLRGKSWLQSVTTGMHGQTYTAEGLNRATMTELLKPFERTARFCGMDWLEPLIFHGSHDADDDSIERHCQTLLRLLAEIP